MLFSKWSITIKQKKLLFIYRTLLLRRAARLYVRTWLSSDWPEKRSNTLLGPLVHRKYNRREMTEMTKRLLFNMSSVRVSEWLLLKKSANKLKKKKKNDPPAWEGNQPSTPTAGHQLETRDKATHYRCVTLRRLGELTRECEPCWSSCSGSVCRLTG